MIKDCSASFMMKDGFHMNDTLESDRGSRQSEYRHRSLRLLHVMVEISQRMLYDAASVHNERGSGEEQQLPLEDNLPNRRN
jgi:hypothetical protein